MKSSATKSLFFISIWGRASYFDTYVCLFVHCMYGSIFGNLNPSYLLVGYAKQMSSVSIVHANKAAQRRVVTINPIKKSQQ